jgi:chemotaxis protein CheC
MSVPAPSALQQDALGEVTNIGSGHAASMLARLVGALGVMVDLPRISVTPAQGLVTVLGGGGPQMLSAGFRIEGGLSGWLVWALPLADAQTLGDRLLLREKVLPGHVQGSGRYEALSEAANIVASACLSAIGTLTGLKLLPSPPALEEGELGSLLQEAAQEAGPDTAVVVLESRFQSTDTPAFGGRMAMVLTPASLQVLLRKLGVG